MDVTSDSNEDIEIGKQEVKPVSVSSDESDSEDSDDCNRKYREFHDAKYSSDDSIGEIDRKVDVIREELIQDLYNNTDHITAEIDSDDEVDKRFIVGYAFPK